MDSLISKGLLVAPIYKNSSILKISAINSSDFGDQDVLAIVAVDHIVDLDIGQTQVTILFSKLFLIKKFNGAEIK